MKNLFLLTVSMVLMMPFIFGADDVSGLVTGDISAEAQADQPQTPPEAAGKIPAITGVRVGIDGCWKAGMITPVSVFVADAVPGTEYLLEIRSVDSDKTPIFTRSSFRYAGPDTPVYGRFLPGQASADLEIAVLNPENKQELAVRRFSPEKVRDQNRDAEIEVDPNGVLFRFPIQSARPLWLTTAAEPNGLSEAAGIWRAEERERPQIFRAAHFSDLPSDRHGYDAVDILFFSASDSGFFDGTDPADVRFEALEQWIQNGGRLVISGGKDSIPLLTGPLARFLPGSAAPELKEIRIANDLVQFVPNTKKLVMTGTLDHPFLNLPVMTPAADAVVDLSEGGLPLIVRQVRSLGTVTYFAGDTADSPLADWNGRDRIWLGILGTAEEHSQTKAVGKSLIQLGYSDLSGQLRSTLDRFDGVKNFPFSVILILIGCYVLVIGPLDWFLTHRVVKHPNLTWLTFPLWLVLFSVTAVCVGERIRPDSPKFNQVDVIDWDAASGLVRGSSWAGLYSPSDRFYEMAFQPVLGKNTSAVPESVFGGLGLDGSGLGGTEQKTITPSYWHDPYEVLCADGTIAPVPVRVRSSKSFFGEWTAKTEPEASSILTLKNGNLTGTVTNPFSVSLTDAILYYDKWAYRVGTLAPGETFTVDRKTPKIDSSRIYGGAADPFNEGRTDTMMQSGLDRYNTVSTNPAEIVQMMMFHQTAGGLAEVGLTNSRHHRLDCRELLRGGRAVLTGTFAPLETEGNEKPFPHTDLMIRNTPEGDCCAAAGHPVYMRYFCPVMPETF